MQRKSVVTEQERAAIQAKLRGGSTDEPKAVNEAADGTVNGAAEEAIVGEAPKAEPDLPMISV